jgi:bisphosphoglycerate-independent phosphoglycerate mutase (AlkP superfamily)
VACPRQLGNSESATPTWARAGWSTGTDRNFKIHVDGDFFQNCARLGAIENMQTDTAPTSVRLLSDGGLHSHIEHLYALLKLQKPTG